MPEPSIDYLQVTVDTEGAPARVMASGEIDAASAPELGRMIDAALDVGGGVVLDFSAITFMDSSGLRVVTVALNRAREQGQPFAVASASDAVQRIFDMTGVTDILGSPSSAEGGGDGTP